MKLRTVLWSVDIRERGLFSEVWTFIQIEEFLV